MAPSGSPKKDQSWRANTGREILIKTRSEKAQRGRASRRSPRELNEREREREKQRRRAKKQVAAGMRPLMMLMVHDKWFALL